MKITKSKLIETKAMINVEAGVIKKNGRRWISVENYLPRYYQQVVVKLFGKSKLEVDSVRERKITDARGKTMTVVMWQENQTPGALYVTHWTPIPLLPKGVE